MREIFWTLAAVGLLFFIMDPEGTAKTLGHAWHVFITASEGAMP